jgi:hypothetical protein
VVRGNEVLREAWNAWATVRARIVWGASTAVFTFIAGLAIDLARTSKVNFWHSLVAALLGLVVYGMVSFLWYLWLAPFTVLARRIDEAVGPGLQKAEAHRPKLGATSETLLCCAAVYGQTIESNDSIVALSDGTTLGRGGDPGYPASRAAVEVLLEEGLIEPTNGAGVFQVSKVGHLLVDRMAKEHQEYLLKHR